MVTRGVTARTRHAFFSARGIKPVFPTAASAAQSLAILQFAWLMLWHAGHCVMYAQMQFQVYLSRIDSNENPKGSRSYPSITADRTASNRPKNRGGA